MQRTALSLLLAISIAATGLLAQEPKPRLGSAAKGLAKIGLSAEQRTKIAAITAEHGRKIAELRSQISKLQEAEKAAIAAVLTPEQRKEYRRALEAKALPEPAQPPPANNTKP